MKQNLLKNLFAMRWFIVAGMLLLAFGMWKIIVVIAFFALLVYAVLQCGSPLPSFCSQCCKALQEDDHAEPSNTAYSQEGMPVLLYGLCKKCKQKNKQL